MIDQAAGAVRRRRRRRDAQPREAVGAVPGRASGSSSPRRALAGIGHGDTVVRRSTGLAVRRGRAVGADFIVKGLRTAGDFEIEQQMAHNNHAVTGIRTVYLPCSPELGLHQQPVRPRDRASTVGRSNTSSGARGAEALASRCSQLRDEDDDMSYDDR